MGTKRDFAQDTLKTVPRVRPPAVGQRLQVNPKNRKLYVQEQGDPSKSADSLFEIDPETGKIAVVSLPFDAEDFCFDINGLAYLRTEHEVVRYDPTTWREVPWDYGEERDSVAFCGKAAKDLLGVLATPGVRPVCFHQDGLWVSPKGHLAVSCVSRGHLPNMKEDWKPAGQTGKPYTPKMFPGRARWQEVHVWDKYGKLVFEDAVPGLHMLDGVAIDNADNLFVMAVANRMIDNHAYPGVMANTLIKVHPAKAKVLSMGATEVPLPKESQPSRSPDMLGGCYAGRSWVEGAEWFYGGVGFDEFNGSAITGRICGCWNSRFTMDYFSRSYAPEIYTYSVAVLDTSGNLVTRIGHYGNVDDGVPMVSTKQANGVDQATTEQHALNTVPHRIGGDEVGLFHPRFTATQTDRRVFISDTGNFRIVSVKLGYYIEEKLTLKNVKNNVGK